MEPIRRTGPPVPTHARGSEYDVSVPLNAMPSRTWQRCFQAPEEWKDPCHPSRITVKGRALLFTSEEAHLGSWMRWIDEWIIAANGQTAAMPDASLSRQTAQAEEAREQQRRLEEATERFKTR